MNAILQRLPRPVSVLLWAGLVVLFFVCLSVISPAQDDRAVGDKKPVAAQQDVDQPDPVAKPAPDPLHSTVSENIRESWTVLKTYATYPKKPAYRIQALAALGAMGSNPQAAIMISTAMQDPDQDVRLAAVLAAGQTKNHSLTTAVRTLLDDKQPAVAFTAASVLWKMGDHSGEDILMAVADGDRKANAGMVNGTMHSANKELHDPAALAKDGAMQVGGLFLGPFGYGLSAYEYMRRSGGVSARGAAIDMLAQEKTGPIRTELISALEDKDPAVRAAAASALGNYHESDVATHLLPLFADPKLPVRLTVAAAYIRSTGSSAPAIAKPRHKG